MAVPPIAGLLIGRYLDNRFNTNLIFTIVLLVMGFIASFREVKSVLKKAEQKSDKNDNADTK
jgi:F0F1-type ATP synthase assembly protein I